MLALVEATDDLALALESISLVSLSSSRSSGNDTSNAVSLRRIMLSKVGSQIVCPMREVAEFEAIYTWVRIQFSFHLRDEYRGYKYINPERQVCIEKMRVDSSLDDPQPQVQLEV
jgi:hypothetical protein